MRTSGWSRWVAFGVGLSWSGGALAAEGERVLGPQEAAIEHRPLVRARGPEDASPWNAGNPLPERGSEGASNNAFYVELGGAGLFYTMNYERAFGDFSARVGAGYFTFVVVSSGNSILSVPVTVNYLGVGSGAHRLDLGAGVTTLHVSNGGDGVVFLPDGKMDASTAILATAIAGYRYQPVDGGFVFRAGVTALAGSDFVLPMPHLAFGGAF